MTESKEVNADGSRPGTPIPDPTERTLDQSRREISMLRELLETKLHGMGDVNSLLKEFNEEIRNHLRVEISALKELQGEKFKGVADQFVGRDTALTAALQAQKESAGAQQIANSEAIKKSEDATGKQMNQTGEAVKNVEKTLGDKIEDAKERQNTAESRQAERMAALEARQTAVEANKKGGSDVWAIVIGIVGLLVGIAVAVATFMAIHATH